MSIEAVHDESSIKKLIILEDLQQQNKLTLPLSKELVGIYYSLILRFDSKNDPVSLYFLDKVQTAMTNLTRPTSHDPRSKFKIDLIFLEEKSDEKMMNLLNENPCLLFERRARNRYFNFKLEDIIGFSKENSENLLSNSLKKFKKIHKELDDEIQKQLENQEDRIETTLAHRRRRKRESMTLLMKRSQSLSMLSLNFDASQMMKRLQNNLLTSD